jgi:hypothetical protein
MSVLLPAMAAPRHRTSSFWTTATHHRQLASRNRASARRCTRTRPATPQPGSSPSGKCSNPLPPSHSSCSLPDSGKESLGSIAAPKPKLRNILVLPDRAIQQPTPQHRAGHSVSLSMKTSGCVDNRSQTATRSTPIHGWQEVRRKVWRKKLTNPSLQPRRSVHERLQGPEASARQTDSSQKQPPQSSWLEAFKRQTNGRCFRCLASNHRVADCRDPGRL